MLNRARVTDQASIKIKLEPMAAVKNPPKKSAVKKTATKKVKSNGSATAKVNASNERIDTLKEIMRTTPLKAHHGQTAESRWCLG